MTDEKKKEEKSELANDFIKTLEDLEGITEIEKMIKDNKVEFKIDDVKYRVRQPSFEEQKELETYRRKIYLKLLDDDSMIFQKQLIEKYKKKGIDIDDMEKQIRAKKNLMNQVMIRLAQTSEESRVKELEDEILALRSEMALLNIERADLLSFSIEDQLMIAVNSYYTYLVLEKLVGSEDPYDKPKEWERVFKTFEEFDKSQNTKLIHRAFKYVSHLLYKLGF